MHFKTKIICGYAAFVLVVAIGLGVFLNAYMCNQYEEREYRNMGLIGEQLEQSFYEYVEQMDLVIDYILSDIQIIESIRLLKAPVEDNIQSIINRNDVLTNIRLKINNDYIRSNFYRVLFYNAMGDIITSNNWGDQLVNSEKDLNEVVWLKDIKSIRGKATLIDPHIDDWGLKTKPMVFSLVKKIHGDELGYIEVQQQCDILPEIFQVLDENIGVVVVRENGTILYSNVPRAYDAFYLKLAEETLNSTREYKNVLSGKEEMISTIKSREGAATILVIKEVSKVREAAAYSTQIIILITTILVAISFIYIIIIANHLTAPIRNLRNQMENTELKNLGQEVVMDASNDEIRALQKSYQRVLRRLEEAIIREKKQALLQMEAQFDLLQAQVNPHFLYNVLNVLSSRGIISGDETICEICSSLADMLRYSTGNTNRQATLAEELRYLKEYFYLLKTRYDYKLDYTIDIEESLKDEEIPKIVLQQIVENSIKHGYVNTSSSMQIEVKGWQEGDRWYISVTDNGEGFSEEALEQLKKKLVDTKVCLRDSNSNMAMEIGGMGLINTYARLYLAYGEALEFEIINMRQGAKVIIGNKKQ